MQSHPNESTVILNYAEWHNRVLLKVFLFFYSLFLFECNERAAALVQLSLNFRAMHLEMQYANRTP